MSLSLPTLNGNPQPLSSPLLSPLSNTHHPRFPNFLRAYFQAALTAAWTTHVCHIPPPFNQLSH